jgi:hypothetical protein
VVGKYAGLGLSDLRELRELREENTKLKRLVAISQSIGGLKLNTCAGCSA